MDYSAFKNEGKIMRECAEKIFTKDDLLNFVEEINKRQQLVFKNKNGRLSNAKLPENGFLNGCLGTLGEKAGVFLETPQKESMFLEELKKYLLGMSFLKLQTAFEPSGKFLEKISRWLEKELEQKIILDISVNPKITAGAIIEYQGKYLNLSLGKEIDELTLPRI